MFGNALAGERADAGGRPDRGGARPRRPQGRDTTCLIVQEAEAFEPTPEEVAAARERAERPTAPPATVRLRAGRRPPAGHRARRPQGTAGELPRRMRGGAGDAAPPPASAGSAGPRLPGERQHAACAPSCTSCWAKRRWRPSVSERPLPSPAQAARAARPCWRSSPIRVTSASPAPCPPCPGPRRPPAGPRSAARTGTPHTRLRPSSPVAQRGVTVDVGAQAGLGVVDVQRAQALEPHDLRRTRRAPRPAHPRCARRSPRPAGDRSPGTGPGARRRRPSRSAAPAPGTSGPACRPSRPCSPGAAGSRSDSASASAITCPARSIAGRPRGRPAAPTRRAAPRRARPGRRRSAARS